MTRGTIGVRFGRWMFSFPGLAALAGMMLAFGCSGRGERAPNASPGGQPGEARGESPAEETARSAQKASGDGEGEAQDPNDIASEDRHAREADPPVDPALQEEAGRCPEGLELEAVYSQGDTLIVAHDVASRADVEEVVEIDEEDARELGRPDPREPYWVFPRDGEPACSMKQAEPIVVPVSGLGFLDRVVLASRLEGECAGVEDISDVPSERPLFGATSDVMPRDCRLERLSSEKDERGEGREIPARLVDLRDRLGADDELGCDAGRAGCTLHWAFRQLELDNGRRLFYGEVVETHPPPEDRQVVCRDKVARAWSSGVVLEKDGELHDLAQKAWPRALRVGVKGERESILGLTNEETRLVAWSIDEGGMPRDQVTHQWWEVHEEDVPAEAGLAAKFGCRP